MDTDKMAHAMARWWQNVNDRDEQDARPMLYDPIQGGRTSKGPQYLATFIVCLCAAGAGTGLSWTSPVLVQLQSPNSTIFITKEQGTWIASNLAIGAIVGAVPSGLLADKIGRRSTAIVICIPYIASWLMVTFAQSVQWLYYARILIGLSVGGSCVVAPLYISEFVETSIRGSMGTCFQLFLTIGILFVFCAGAAVDWIQLSWMCLVLPIANLVGLFFIPESPIWLLKNNREEEAASALKWFWGRFCNANNAIQAIKSEMEASSGSSGLRELFSVKANRKGFFICVSLMFFQQFSGINAVIFFATQIFESAGSNIKASVCSIIIGIVQVLMTFAAAALVEKAGRKILLLLSSTVMCLCLATLGVYFYLKEVLKYDVSNIGIIPLLSLILFIICFSLGYGPIPWMMMGEMLSSDIKSIASSIAVEFNWIAVFIVTKSFEPAEHLYGSAPTFWFFSVIMFIGSVYGYFVLFETKGKSNTEIQMRLSGEK